MRFVPAASRCGRNIARPCSTSCDLASCNVQRGGSASTAFKWTSGTSRFCATQGRGERRELLRAGGFDAPGAALPRDPGGGGPPKGAARAGGSLSAPRGGGGASGPPRGQLPPAVLVSVDGVGPLLVVKTPAGGAQALGLALDAAGWTEIIGTIAGDDAVLVITKSERARRAVQTRIKELAGIPD